MSLPSVSPLVIFITCVIFTLSLVVFLVSCLCKSAKERNSNYGIEGQLKYTPAHSEISKNGNAGGQTAELRNKSATINRQLPDIPKESTSDNIPKTGIDSQSSNVSLQLYEVVPDLHAGNSIQHANETGAQASNNIHMQMEASTSKTPVGHPYAVVDIQSEHAYDKIVNQSTDTSENSISHMYATTSNVNRQSSRKQTEETWENSNAYEYPPPVPEKMFDVVSEPEQPDEQLEEEVVDHPENHIADDVGANIEVEPMQDVPFEPGLHVVDNEDTPSEGPYTSISVREPIANLRAAELLRQQERMTHVYTMVSEDDQDQTYAEIASSRRKSSSSSSYTLLKNGNTSKSSDDLPPDPPTVESLMSVTQAHSRQASDASSASHSILSSPETAREKPLKALAEQSQLQEHSSQIKSSATLPASINLDELYAKVKKTKSPDFPKMRKNPNRSPKSIFGHRRVISMDYSNQESGAVNVTKVSRKSSAFEAMPSTSNFRLLNRNMDPFLGDFKESRSVDYESLKRNRLEPGYETIKNTNESDSANEPDYETLHSNISNQSDPTYESVSKTLPVSVKYEENQLIDIEPPYEGIGEGSSKPYEIKDADINDPPYEGIRDDNCEPPYEGIKHVDSPPYEGINLNNSVNDIENMLVGDMGSLTLNDTSSSEDPAYEGIKPLLDSNLSRDSAVYDVPKQQQVYDDESDPLYEGLNVNNTNMKQHKRRSHTSLQHHSYSCSESSEEEEYERIKGDTFTSDGSEPGYETVRNSYIEEPTYETLRPKKNPNDTLDDRFTLDDAGSSSCDRQTNFVA